MSEHLHSPKNFSPEEVERILKEGIKILGEFLNKEFCRQSGNQENLISSTEFNANPVPPHYYNLVWLGNDESLTSIYVGAVIKMEIFIATEEQFRMIFSKMPIEEKIIIRAGRISEAVHLFRGLADHDVKLIARDQHLQNVMPELFLDDRGDPVKYGTIKSRVNLFPCVKSEKRKNELDALIEDAKWINKNR